MYIVEVTEDGEKFQYEFSNIVHARELYNSEQTAILIEYKNGKYYLVECKA